MIEIYPNLFVGNGNDLIHADDGAGGIAPGWFVISAAKEPFHREALGYTGRGAPKDHPDYLIARRPGRLILNLVDVEDPAYIREEIVAAALEEIDVQLAQVDLEGRPAMRVLIHCNQGHSRAPMLALLWLRWHCKTTRPFLAAMTVDEAVIHFGELYPGFAPAGGMVGYARNHWEAE